MRITLIVLFFAALAAVPAQADDSPEAWLIPFAAAYQPQVSGFNAKFAEHGMPEARSRHFGWGLELRSLTGSFLVGPLFFRTLDDVENEGYQLRTDATGIFGELGVKLAPASFLTIVPLIGLGGLSQSFNVRAKSDSLSLDELLGIGAPQAVSFSSGMKLTGLGALELGLAVNTKAGRFGVTLRGGYIYSPFKPTWRLSNGAQVTGEATEDTRLGGPFFSVGLLMMPTAQTATTTQ
ncbi:MAG: hypothetical protein NTX53_01425 [candidate division WOR-3 bacterium]|nr:hypothetical protein [candidate division WOR-3 bacterium]